MVINDVANEGGDNWALLDVWAEDGGRTLALALSAPCGDVLLCHLDAIVMTAYVLYAISLELGDALGV